MVGLSFLGYYVVYIPGTLAVLLLYILTGVAILLTVLGLRRKDLHSPRREELSKVGSLFSIAGFFLGILGVWFTWLGFFFYDRYSEQCREGGPGLVTCPWAGASYYTMWILLVGLLVPFLFFFIVPEFVARLNSQPASGRSVTSATAIFVRRMRREL